MVQIANKVNFYFVIVSLLIVLGYSCTILRKDTQCILVNKSNEIIGNDKNAPTLEIKSLYLTSLISHLFDIPKQKSSEAFFRGYNVMKDPIYAGYKISGCSDTLRAKVMMAHHLLNKYNMIRKDSVYLDTIYKIEIINQDKLPINRGDCSEISITMKKDSAEIYSTRTCLNWNSFFINIVDHLCFKQHCKPLEIPKGKGKMDMIIPIRMKLSHDIDGLLDFYEEVYGLRITQERIDSVEVILYKESFEMH